MTVSTHVGVKRRQLTMNCRLIITQMTLTISMQIKSQISRSNENFFLFCHLFTSNNIFDPDFILGTKVQLNNACQMAQMTVIFTTTKIVYTIGQRPTDLKKAFIIDVIVLFPFPVNVNITWVINVSQCVVTLVKVIPEPFQGGYSPD